MISYIVQKNEYSPKGSFTFQVKWKIENFTGFLVQYVEIDDPLGVIPNYDDPYYEAWEVEDGKVLYDSIKEIDDFDDEFSNECSGTFRSIAQEGVQMCLEKKEKEETYVTYFCRVFLVGKDNSAYGYIKNWKKGKVSMAGNLIRSSYKCEYELGNIELQRVNYWSFQKEIDTCQQF